MNVKPDTKNATPVEDMRSHHLKPAEMAWEKTRFPGCEIKPLLFDAKSGLATVLVRMAAGRGAARP